MTHRPTVLTVVGARPQFVKAAPLSRALRRRFREVLVHTGQHYDREMSESFFEDLDIPPPDRHLGVGSGSHGAMTGRMLALLETAMMEVRPDLVVVIGDTNSTLAGALAAAKLGLPVAHVEAGLRSYDNRMPEEINRRLTDHVSALLLCPTSAAVSNLQREGITRGVHHVGDVMKDAVVQNLERARRRPRPPGVPPPGEYYLATVHRQENVDDRGRLRDIVAGLEALPAPVVWPVHPRARRRMQSWRLRPGGAVRLLPPAGYLDMLLLEDGARAVLTDSGGVQKEAFLLGRPCITLRETTEWVETVAAGANRLVGSDPVRIRRAVARVERDGTVRAAYTADEYGAGHASEKIASVLARFLGRRR
ncbi:MAG TPA: UDP-N-acetylglucosamine 2-epimerase (non-hydrolyzing) [Vicinamibacteria bacterium]|nr:UDP-N-acetylglucosamine 2-epimerase (non-hydrolyzing) [Vicinamibacteria bacterium]